jgi:hypothetical protein
MSTFTDNPVIQRLRDERHQSELCIKAKAAALYATFTKDERLVVRFGMMPADKMLALDAELKAMKEQGDFPMFDNCDLARIASVGVMDAANAGPDKLVV